MVYSFDVFDTCLCRLCGEPRLMFDVLSLKVQETMGESCSEQLRQVYVASRTEASGGNLKEIYDNVSQSFPLPWRIEQMAEMELEVERQMLMPIVETRRLVDSLREKGDVCFISDMYLPSTFIRKRLVEHGFFKEGDRLYVSNELQAWKHDGSLFRLIHEREGFNYKRWHHYGNCRHSDYRMPRSLGIHAHHLTFGYLPYEEQWRRIPVLQFQYPAILAGVARAVRLSTPAPKDQKAFVCDISAPLMLSWVLRVMKDGRNHGIRRLYFCARDTHTQFLIAKRLQPLFSELTIHYLFISREALRVENKEDVFRFFFEKGLASSDKTAIVDSNSSGETLRALNRMMEEHACNPVAGYYLVADVLPKNAMLTFPSIYPRYVGSLGNKRGRSLMGMKLFFELVLSLNYHSKTVGYERHGNMERPVFGEDADDQWCIVKQGVREAKKLNDRLALGYCDAFLNTGLCRYGDQLFEQVAIPTLTSFFAYPQKTCLRYLHRFVWWGRPLVGSVFGKAKGLWHRGSLIFCLPGFLSKWIWKNQ